MTGSAAGPRFTFRRLGDSEAGAFGSLTYPRYRPLLCGNHSADGVLALGVEDGAPVGLALARVEAAGAGAGAHAHAHAEILSLCVRAECRSRGLGTALLAHLEEELQAAGCRWAHLSYLTHLRSLYVLERLLERAGWEPPYDRQFIYGTHLDACRDMPWLHSPAARVRPPAEYFSWQDLTAAERQDLRSLEGAPDGYPQSLSPFIDEEHIAHLSSVGIRLGGRVVAWEITHFLDPATIRYTANWARPNLQRRGYSIAVMAEAFRRQRVAGVPGIQLATLADNRPMRAFIERHFAPFQVWHCRSVGRWKRLSPGRSARGPVGGPRTLSMDHRRGAG